MMTEKRMMKDDDFKLLRCFDDGQTTYIHIIVFDLHCLLCFDG